jgi:hypothetical protein
MQSDWSEIKNKYTHMKMHSFSALYQKLIFTLAYNFFGNAEEAQYIVQQTYLRWIANGNAAQDNSEMSPIRIAAKLCMEIGKPELLQA